MAAMTKTVAPLAFDAWYTYHFSSASLSLKDRKFVQDIIESYAKNQVVSKEALQPLADNYNFTKREYNDFWEKIKSPEHKDFDISNYEEVE